VAKRQASEETEATSAQPKLRTRRISPVASEGHAKAHEQVGPAGNDRVKRGIGEDYGSGWQVQERSVGEMSWPAAVYGERTERKETGKTLEKKMRSPPTGWMRSCSLQNLQRSAAHSSTNSRRSPSLQLPPLPQPPHFFPLFSHLSIITSSL
jgi:hypothetical protein